MSLFICGFIIFCVLFSVIYFFVCWVFNKGNNVRVYWASPYECGFSPNSLSFNCFSFTCFSLLVFFVVFDLEISLLLNMPGQGLLFENFYCYYSFLFILFVGFCLEVIMGYVRWGY
uniref:NADH-ubiquinone oxidoreductase chain 3 n=1 Tax=Moniezia sp. MN-2015 TaxID=1768671 RepID=A0A7R6PPI9_9CEST|nr:NADH dehydrogenase subunit 3 [Moniezia sp. MN-2015]